VALLGGVVDGVHHVAVERFVEVLLLLHHWQDLVKPMR
jgi:hypothetical protein